MTIASVTHILPFTLIRRERVLPGTGRVLVRAQQKVAAADTIAEANTNAEYMLLDVARGLGLSAEKSEKYIKCKPGDQLSEKDILAGPVGLMRRVVRSPQDGKVILAGSGQVLLELGSKPFQLKAGIPGDVVELIPDRGAIIETTGGLVQGVWGNGQVDFGVLTLVAKAADHQLVLNDLDVSMRGSIVMAGYCDTEDILKAAEELPLRGLILASASSALAPAMAKLQIPVLILEGFGQHAYNQVAYKLLSSSDRREVALCAHVWDPYTGARPEIIIPAPASGSVYAPPEAATFEVNQTVRVKRAPFVGAIGIIRDLKGQVAFPGGLRAQGAEVRLENGATAVIPLANLEVVA